LKAEFEIEGQKIELDTSEMEERINKNVKGLMKGYFEEVKEWRKTKERGGKGVVELFNPDAKKAIVEAFQKGEKMSSKDVATIREQWTIAVPKYAINELVGHLRDYVWVTDVVKGKPGETVNIPYVNDIKFQHVTPKTGPFTVKTDLVGVITTDLHESGAYYDAYYGDIEKIDANLLDELNRVFAHAALRAEDDDLIALINTATTGQFLSEGGGSSSLAPLFAGDTPTITSAMSANKIVDALAALMQRGKEVHPGECICYMNARLWQALMKSVMGSTPIAHARPDIIQKGLVEDFLGVKIVVGSKQACYHDVQGRYGASSYEFAYLMRPKRALALAPKRDILIETDKLIASRQLRIAASHTYGVAAIDFTEVVPILTGSGDF